MRKSSCLATLVFLIGCSEAPPPTPALTEQTAIELLHQDPKAKNWLEFVKKNNAACEYLLQMPDQASHPTQLDFSHIVSCGGRPSPREFDATASFVYDKAAQHWTVSRFAS